jgi:hypothetical protein
MDKPKNYNFTCEVCDKEGDYLDFIDLTDDVDPWGIFVICPICYFMSKKTELIGSLILLTSFLLIFLFEYTIKDQFMIPVLIYCYILNFIRRIVFARFLIQKIKRDNYNYPINLLIAKLRNQFFLFLITPLDLLTSPMRFYYLREKLES